MSDGPNRWMRIIVNGKSAGDPALREAVATIREQGYRLEVRVTWEGGDAARYAGEPRPRHLGALGCRGVIHLCGELSACLLNRIRLLR